MYNNRNSYLNFTLYKNHMTQKTYTNGEVTVVWKPEICQHSTHCWKGLLAVFNPQKKPMDQYGWSRNRTNH